MQVLHRCDIRQCVRPGHLFLGTHADNMNDMAQKGRAASGERNAMRLYPELVRSKRGGVFHQPSGELNTAAKLTTDQVREIRERYAAGGVSQQALADEFGVSQPHLSRIVRGEWWTHI